MTMPPPSPPRPRFILYGQCSFSGGNATKRRDDTITDVVAYAAANGLTAYAWGVFPAGAVATTIGGQPALTICYSAATIEAAEAAEAVANDLLQGRQYEGFIGHLDNG